MGVCVAKYGMYLQSFFLSLLIISELLMALFPGGTTARKQKQTNKYLKSEELYSNPPFQKLAPARLLSCLPDVYFYTRVICKEIISSIKMLTTRSLDYLEHDSHDF